MPCETLVDQAWTRITLALRLRVLDYPYFRFQRSLLRYLSSDMSCIVYGLREVGMSNVPD